MTGIVSVALKSHLYGRYAFNLCMSLKAIAPDIPFTLVADEAALADLTEGQKFFFDKIIPCPKKYCYDEGKLKPLLTKFHLHELSPYDRTLFLDADTILNVNANIYALFQELEGIGFTMANRGIDGGITDWVDKEYLQREFSPDKWYDLSSEVIYFEKGEKSAKVFETARDYYDSKELNTTRFAGDQPDEPFFALAMDNLKCYPHKDNWLPLYWRPQEKRAKTMLQVQSEYIGMSAGGRGLPKDQLKIYTQITNAVQAATGEILFSYLHKKNYLPERQLL